MARRKMKTRKHELDAQQREDILYMLAHICNTMMRDNRGVVGDVARAIEGSVVAPPIDPTHIQRYFGGVKGFGAVEELASIVAGGVPVNAVMSWVNLERALQYGNHRKSLRASASNMGENGGRCKMPKMFSDTKISRERNPESKSLSVSGRRDTQG